MSRDLQTAQNKVLRLLTGSRRIDKHSAQEMLQKLGLLSVNQMIAQTRLLEAWKAMNIPGHPLSAMFVRRAPGETLPSNTRAACRGDLNVDSMSKSFKRTTSKLWNLASQEVKNAKTLNQARCVINAFAKSLPI